MFSSVDRDHVEKVFGHSISSSTDFLQNHTVVVRNLEHAEIMNQIDDYNWFCSVEELVDTVKYVLAQT
jgi:hypothetical protein